MKKASPPPPPKPLLPIEQEAETEFMGNGKRRREMEKGGFPEKRDSLFTLLPFLGGKRTSYVLLGDRKIFFLFGESLRGKGP